jgi:hypothetical protein
MVKNEKCIQIYKSEKERKAILLPSEYHRILKLEAKKQGKTICGLLIEAIRLFLKI